MLFGGKKYSIGIDIGSRSIRLVKLTGTKDKPVLSQFGSIGLPKGAVSGGEIVDVQAVSEALQNLYKKIGLKEKSAVLGVGNQRVVVRFVDLPYMDQKELASAIKFQAQDFIPIPVEDAIIDYQIIGDYFSETGERFLQIMLVAAHKGMISMFIEAAEKAGLKPEIIDVNAFAIVRSLSKASIESRAEIPHETYTSEEESLSEMDSSEGEYLEESKIEENVEEEAEDLEVKESPQALSEGEIQNEVNEIYEVDESAFLDEDEGPPKITDGKGESETVEDFKEVVAYVDIGADVTNLCVVEEGSVKFVRVIGIGGEDWTDAIVEIFGVSYDEAEEIKIKVGLPPLSGERYIDVPGNYLDLADRTFSVLEKEIIRFIGELRRSFEYYVSQTGGHRITKIVVSGGSSSLKNLNVYLEKGLDVEVERRDPFSSLSIPVRIKEQLALEDRLSYTIAVGLALRGFE